MCSWWTQFVVLLRRAMLGQLRNPTDTTSRLFLSTWVGVLAGAPDAPLYAYLLTSESWLPRRCRALSLMTKDAVRALRSADCCQDVAWICDQAVMSNACGSQYPDQHSTLQKLAGL